MVFLTKASKICHIYKEGFDKERAKKCQNELSFRSTCWREIPKTNEWIDNTIASQKMKKKKVWKGFKMIL